MARPLLISSPIPSKPLLTSEVKAIMLKSTAVYLADHEGRGGRSALGRVPPCRLTDSTPSARGPMGPHDSNTPTEQTIAMPQSSLNRPTERGSTNMESTDDRRWEPANGAGPLHAGVAPAKARDDSRPPPAGATTHPDHRAADVSTDPPPASSPPASVPPSHPWRKALLSAGAVAGLALGAYFLAPTVKTMLDTISTDDAYVNGHVTYVAPQSPDRSATSRWTTTNG